MAESRASLKEVVAQFGPRRSLVGIAGIPAPLPDPMDATALVFLNVGKLPRAAPHRLQVDMCRHFGARGRPSLRFDLRGLGDSKRLAFEPAMEARAVEDLTAAMDWMARETGIRSFIMVGLCAGARKAGSAALVDPRIRGLVSVNGAYDFPWGDDGMEELRARTQGRYYWKRILDRRSWTRLLAGGSDLGALRAFAVSRMKSMVRPPSVSNADGVTSTWHTLLQNGLPLFFFFTEGSDSLDAYRMYCADAHAALLRHPRFSYEVLRGADHVFTPLWTQRDLTERVHEWLQQWFPLDARPSPGGDRAAPVFRGSSPHSTAPQAP